MSVTFKPASNALANLRRLAAAGDDYAEGIMAILDSTLCVALTAAAEGSNSITISGQIKDLDGNNVSGVKNVLIRSKAPTGTGNLSDGGDGAVVAGAASTSCWMTTTATGSFQVAVANANAEQTLVEVTVDGGTTEIIVLTFA
jgi:hypothetical protein